MNKSKGITLIALVITIIVMLILLGVTINIVIQGGLITTTKKATYQTELSIIKEELEVKKAIKVVENGGNIPSDYNISIDDLDISDELKNKYRDKLLIENGKLYYDSEVITNTEEQEWCEQQQIYSKPIIPEGYTGIWNSNEDGKKTISDIKDNPGANYIIMENINLPANWETIPLFSGTLDGNGKQITIASLKETNITFNSNTISVMAIIGECTGTIKNIKTVGTLDITLSNINAIYVSPLTAISSGGANYTNCYNNANITITGNQNNSGILLGGISAISGTGTISFEKCGNTGNMNVKQSNITGMVRVSGIVANMIGGNTTIHNCFNSGNIKGEDAHAYCAGISAYAYTTGTISHSYNTGRIEAKDISGGISTNASGSEIISYCYNLGSITTDSGNYNYAIANIYTGENCKYIDDTGIDTSGAESVSSITEQELSNLINDV